MEFRRVGGLCFPFRMNLAGRFVADYGGRIVSNRPLEGHGDGVVVRLVGYARLSGQLQWKTLTTSRHVDRGWV